MQLAERGLQVAREYSYEQVAERLAGVLFSCMGDLAG
jgi:hypothetical protein